MKRRVLGADASMSLLEAIQISFQSAGFDVYTSRDGRDVMELATEIEPDAVLLGISLPGKSGYTLARDLSSEDKFRHIPLFFLIGVFEEVDQSQLSGLFFEDMIRAPIDSGALASRVKRLLDEQSAPRTLPEEPEWIDSADFDSRFQKAWQEKEKEFRENITRMVRKEVLEAERELEKRLSARPNSGVDQKNEGKGGE
ncbi:MAG: response regulator [Candidatus Aminicenantes bacterium]